MTLRERIADWISGGALTKGLATRSRLLALAEYWVKQYDYAFDMWRLSVARAEAAEEKLRRIAAQETPKANATVKRMARIARGEA